MTDRFDALGEAVMTDVTSDASVAVAVPLADRSEVRLASTCAAWGATLHHGRLDCEHLLAAAAALTAALALLPDEEAADWLAAAGLPLAGVRNLLELHRVALDACALDALGGVPLAVAWAAEARPPRAGEALAVTLGGWNQMARCPWPMSGRAPSTWAPSTPAASTSQARPRTTA